MALAGFIGCGNMGGVLAAAASIHAGGGEVLAADHHPEKTERLREYGVVPAAAQEIAAVCRFIFLGVKPQAMEEAAAEIRGVLERRNEPFTIVSMAAGVSAATVSELVSGVPGGCPVIRIMPNTPAAVGQGVILYCTGGNVEQKEENAFLDLLSAAGSVVKIEESRMDAASAVTGCGPAFVCLFLEAMIDGAVQCGLPRAQAEQFVLKTTLGTAKLSLETGQDLALLREAVCSPAGSTIAGIAALEQRAVRFAAMEAIRAAYVRTKELGK